MIINISSNAKCRCKLVYQYVLLTINQPANYSPSLKKIQTNKYIRTNVRIHSQNECNECWTGHTLNKPLLETINGRFDVTDTGPATTLGTPTICHEIQYDPEG